MDDETYVKADLKQLRDHQYYTRRVGRTVNNKYRHKFVDKFAKKYLIWQAICSCGLSPPFCVCMGTLKTEEYIKKCLKRRRLPVYRQPDVSPIFWSNLAAIHYSTSAPQWYQENNVVLLTKTEIRQTA